MSGAKTGQHRDQSTVNRATHKLVLSGLFTGIAVAVAYAGAPIPNVELLSSVIFLAGYSLGIRQGALTGLTAELVYSLFNPYGMAPLPVLTAQLVSMAIIGAAGGLARTLWPDAERLRGRTLVWLGLAGAGLTLIFDALTTLGTAVMLGFTTASLLGLVSVGAVYYLLHIGSNLFFFATFVPAGAHLLHKSGVLERLRDNSASESAPDFENTPARDTGAG